MGSIKSALFIKTADKLVSRGSGRKITIVGVGQVGMASAFSILTQGISNEICLIDQNVDVLCGEKMDLEHGKNLLKNPQITAGTDYALTTGSRLCIITAGARQKEGESRLSLLQRNADIMKQIVPNLVRCSPNTIILMVSNPVDIMTYIAWKLSGLPKYQIIGSGTNLDSSRFRVFLSEKLGIASTSVQAWIIGEHGDSSVPVWSSVNVAGVRLRDINPCIGTEEDSENWQDIHQKVVSSASEVIKRKGYTSWAIGLNAASIASAILRNSSTIHAVSTYICGYHCIEKDVFLSLPCVLNANGISQVIKQNLSELEIKQLHKSADIINETQKDLKI